MALSLVFHVFVFWPSPAARERAASLPATLLATLAQRAPATDTRAPHLVPKGKRAESTNTAATPPSPARAEATQEPDSSWTADGSVRSRPQASGTTAPSLPAAAAPQESSNGPDADGLRSYRVALARAARRYKRYPSQALEAGWSGTAEVMVTVVAGGIPQDARLARSSGHMQLDEAALEMLRLALPATPVPAVLQGQAFAVNLPVVFEVPAD